MFNRAFTGLVTFGTFAVSSVKAAGSEALQQVSATGAMDIVRSLHHLSGQTGPDASTAPLSSSSASDPQQPSASKLTPGQIAATVVVTLAGVAVALGIVYVCVKNRAVNLAGGKDRLINDDRTTANANDRVADSFTI